MTAPSERLPAEPDDDLSLMPFLRTLWAYRSVMLIAIALIVLAYVAIVLAVYARQPRERIASIGVRLTFEGAAQEQYPNGTKFSAAEIVSTPVLSEVYRLDELSRYGSFEDLKDSMFVLQANPDLELLSLEYQAKLSDSRIGPVERSKLEDEFRQKRDALQSPNISINMRRTERLSQMPEALMNKVLLDTLSTWATQAAQRKGAVRYDIPVVSKNVLQKDLWSSGEDLIAVDTLRVTLERLLDTVDAIGRIPGAAAVRVSNQQYGLADVRANFEDLLRFRVQPLLAEVRAAATARNRAKADLYFEGRYAEAQAAVQQGEQRLSTIQAALASYQAKTAVTANASKDGESNAVTPQVTEGFIDKIVTMATQPRDLKYRQDLTNRIIEEGTQLADLRKQVTYYDSMRRTSAGAAGVQVENVEGTIKAVNEQIGGLVDQLQAIYKVIAEENLNPDTMLYTTTTPFVVRTTSALTFSSVFLYLIVTLLLSCIVVPALCIAHHYSRARVRPQGSRLAGV